MLLSQIFDNAKRISYFFSQSFKFIFTQLRLLQLSHLSLLKFAKLSKLYRMRLAIKLSL